MRRGTLLVVVVTMATVLSIFSLNVATVISSSGTDTTVGGNAGEYGTSQTPEGRWLKGDFHCHSTYSVDAKLGDDVASIVQMAEYLGLDFLAITDHGTLSALSDPGWQSDVVILLPATEWGSNVHAGVIGLSSLIPDINWSAGPSDIESQIQTAIDFTKSQGGIWILTHPCRRDTLWFYNVTGFDAVEVWNTPWIFPEFFCTPQSELAKALAEIGWDSAGIHPRPQMVEALQITLGGENYQALKFWEELLNDGMLVPCVGGGDRHMIMPPGCPTTYVYATSDTIQGVLDGVRNRRTFISRRWDGPTVDFRADADGDGIFESFIGDILPLAGQISFSVTVNDAIDGRLEIVRNGQTIHIVKITQDPFTFTFSDSPTQFSWYRVDVLERLDFSLPDWDVLWNLNLTEENYEDLLTISTNLGFEIICGTGLPTIVLPEKADRILNMELNNPDYARSVITSPIWIR